MTFLIYIGSVCKTGEVLPSGRFSARCDRRCCPGYHSLTRQKSETLGAACNTNLIFVDRASSVG